jgi:DNA-binding MarR family transcriptional regulator
MASVQWLSPDELATWKTLSLMQLQLSAALNRSLSALGISYQDYLVLAGLADQPDGARRVVELGAELGWEKSRASHHISRMCTRGLVKKMPCPTDQRGALVMLTPEGRRLSKAVAPHHVADVRRLFLDHTTVAERQMLLELSSRVLETIATESDCD